MYSLLCPLFVDSLTVAFPVESVVEVNTQVSVVLHDLRLIFQDGNSVWVSTGPPKIHNQLLSFV